MAFNGPAASPLDVVLASPCAVVNTTDVCHLLQPWFWFTRVQLWHMVDKLKLVISVD
jgi:hypothetical protein